MKTHPSSLAAAIAVCCWTLSAAGLTGCSSVSDPKLSRYEEAERIANDHLVKFDTLDFDVYTTQKWERFSESHAKDILVHYPDGHTTKGLDAHIEELKPMFVFAPDTRIETHPVRIAARDWTSVIGVIQGRFSHPMPMPNGKAIPPTGKKFKFNMCTVGHWVNGLMDEEYLFWDNQEFMKQVGLAQ
jgi:predicted ester cyclase